jgi:hypothetical protein
MRVVQTPDTVEISPESKEEKEFIGSFVAGAVKRIKYIDLGVYYAVKLVIVRAGTEIPTEYNTSRSTNDVL